MGGGSLVCQKPETKRHVPNKTRVLLIDWRGCQAPCRDGQLCQRWNTREEREMKLERYMFAKQGVEKEKNDDLRRRSTNSDSWEKDSF